MNDELRDEIADLVRNYTSGGAESVANDIVNLVKSKVAICGAGGFVKCKHNPCVEEACSYGFWGTRESACTPDRDIKCPACL